jgi:hypothetical protein
MTPTSLVNFAPESLTTNRNPMEPFLIPDSCTLAHRLRPRPFVSNSKGARHRRAPHVCKIFSPDRPNLFPSSVIYSGWSVLLAGFP